MFNGGFELKRNAIDLEKYKNDKNLRDEVRHELGVANKFVVGHVGRLNAQKNHPFLLRVFKEYNKKNPNSVLLLVGDGELKDDIVALIKQYGLSDCVKLLGARRDVHRVLQAFDVFVFPSLYEGFGIVVLEAQAAGLPCVISSNIPDEVVLTSLVKKVSLNDNVSKWVDTIESAAKIEKVDEQTIINCIKRAGYDIKTAAADLQDFYLSKSGK
jgi:glycosyltransferase involved in cell wall biosynthesis